MRWFLILFSVALAAGAARATEEPRDSWNPRPSFWMWELGKMPDDSFQELLKTGANQQYWLMRDFQNPREVYRYPVHDIPKEHFRVFRLPPGAETVLKDDIWQTLRGSLRRKPENLSHLEPYFNVVMLQLDFDCPAALLPQYANRLKTLREGLELEHLSITALASWIDAPSFEKLSASVDELVPMFYDLEKDDPADVRVSKVRPMIDDSTLTWIRKWKACKTPWRAGLPNFRRLTIFNQDGTLVGHHRGWSIPGLLNHPAINVGATQPDGTRIYQVTADGTLSETRILAGQRLVWRQPNESTTIAAISAARTSGARGVVWFAHPTSPQKAWHSVAHLAKLQAGEKPEPTFSVEIIDPGMLRLTNHGTGDLPVPVAGGKWQLILEAGPGSFGRGGAGRFSSKKAPGASLNQPGMLRRVVLEFVELRHGADLTTGYQFLTLTDPNDLRWTIEPAP